MRPTCPKCGTPMIRNGAKRWRCFGPNGRYGGVYCYGTSNSQVKQAVDRKGSAPKSPVFKRSLKGKVRFIVTAAQNATPAHAGFLSALEQMANASNAADIIVIPTRYKNPTSRWSASQANEEVWDDKLTPYLCNERKKLAKNLILLGDIKTQPTASSPLTGFEAITHGESGILGHTKLQLRTIPTPQHQAPKILTTTGAVTQPNYTDTKAGKLGEFHHTLGACVVEIDGRDFHLRQLNADRKSGSFVDLNIIYGASWNPSAPYELPGCAALVLGDTHVGFTSPDVERATFGPGGIVDTLKPRYIVWHDLPDCHTVNPHHRGNPFMDIAKRDAGRHLVRAEVERACAYVREHTPAFAKSVIVASNHDDMLRRWILSADWKTDPDNAAFYLETAQAMRKGTRLGACGVEYPSPFAFWARKLLPGAHVLSANESFTEYGIELAMHGDRGPNGARGSIRNLRRIGTKSIIGHSHSPGIEEGCYQVGTSTRLTAEYTSGPSSWMNTHCVVYNSGKRSLINIVNGKWRLE